MNTTNTFDTIVVGGGIVGLSTAYALLQRGKDVLLLEKFGPLHDRGSSHGDGRIIRFAYVDAIYVEMAHHAYPAWERLAERAGRPLHRVTGGLDFGPRGSAELEELTSNFERYDLPYESLSAAECNRRFPQFHLPEGSTAIFQPDAGVVFADLALRTLWSLLTESNATVRPHLSVVGLDLTADGVRVESVDGATWRADRVVIAAGGWTNQLLEQVGLSLPLAVTQEQVSYFPAPATPDHTMHGMPVFIDHHGETEFYGLPRIEIPGVKVAGHGIGQPRDPDSPLPLDDANTRAVNDFVARRLPGLASTPSQQVRCLYTSTPDHDFILDHHPEAPQIVIGAGFSGHGFKFGALTGELLADLATDAQTTVPLDWFSLHRFAGRHLSQEIP